MDTYVKRRVKAHRTKTPGSRLPTAQVGEVSHRQARHHQGSGSCAEAALCLAETPHAAVSTFLPASWHAPVVSEPTRTDDTDAGSRFYNPALAPQRERLTQTPHTVSFLRAPVSPPSASRPAARERRGGFYNPALVVREDASPTHTWTRRTSTSHTASSSEVLCVAALSAQASGATTTTQQTAPFVSTTPPPPEAAPGLYAPTSTRTVKGRTQKELPPLLQHTTLWTGDQVPRENASAWTSTSDGGRLGDEAFSVLVLDFETTGFSPAYEHIVEVGAVELRWTGRYRRDLGGRCAKDGEDENDADVDQTGQPPLKRGRPAQGEWRFGTRSLHCYVDPGKTDAAWWRRRQRRDDRRRSEQHGDPTGTLDSLDATRTKPPTTAESVHGLTPAFLSEYGVSWRAAAEALVAFCTDLQTRSPFSDAEADEDEADESTADKLHALPHPPSTSPEPIAVCLPPFAAHRASFDAAFLEEHLRRAGFVVVWHAQAPVTCTMKLCKALYPQQPANLDAACQFFGINEVYERSRHGALLDATLCAQLFLRLERRVREAWALVE